MGEHKQSVYSQIFKAIRAMKPGSVMTAASFYRFGSSGAVRLALMRHCRDGTIRRVMRGFYSRRRHLPRIGEIGPSVDAVVKAIAKRDAIRVQPTGSYAANLLGLSDQVPARPVFLTDGSNRKFYLGKLMVTFRRTTPRNMATAGTVSGLVIQALRNLGQRHVDDTTVAVLRRRLRDADRRRLATDAAHAPVWIAAIMRKVSAGE
jgi:hypothetical protein